MTQNLDRELTSGRSLRHDHFEGLQDSTHGLITAFLGSLTTAQYSETVVFWPTYRGAEPILGGRRQEAVF